MFSLLGAPALSQFRLDNLLCSLQARDARVSGVSSRFIHFADVSQPLDENELELLGKLLTYGPRAHLHADRGRQLLVTVGGMTDQVMLPAGARFGGSVWTLTDDGHSGTGGRAGG